MSDGIELLRVAVSNDVDLVASFGGMGKVNFKLMVPGKVAGAKVPQSVEADVAMVLLKMLEFAKR